MIDSQPNRGEVRERLEATHRALLATVADETEEALREVKVTPIWNIIDILRHVLSSNEDAVRALHDWHGSRSWMPEIARQDENAFNEQRVAEKAQENLVTVITGLNATHQALLKVLDDSSDAELREEGEAPWGLPISRIDLLGSMALHYQEHTQEIVKVRSGEADDSALFFV